MTDDGDGGTMYVRVAGREVRPSDKHFRTYKIDDLFRAKVVTKLIDDEGVKIKQLSSIAGQCRL